MTQECLIKAHLERSSITPIEALKEYGCFRLASVICKLKAKGMDIITNIITDYRDDEVKRYAEYHLRKKRA